jgi:hypothetical protein
MSEIRSIVTASMILALLAGAFGSMQGRLAWSDEPRLAAVSSAKGGPSVRKSISGWVSCNGTVDESQGVARAFAAARHSAFTLVVDCPVLIQTKMDIERIIFIDNGTTVEFTGTGKFIVENVFLPAFVIANSSDIKLINWNVEYNASLPVNPKTGGYQKNGVFIAGVEPGSAFNDLRITPWLTENRSIKFDQSQGRGTSRWTSPTNTCAVFFIIGDTSNVTVSGMHLSVPAAAGGESFIPVAFSLAMNYKSNQTVTTKTPITGEYVAVPHDITFSNIVLDGTYMGWVGGVRDAVFENIQSHRYGDLQDARGQNVGGVGKWFAPPHLFYLNYAAGGDPALSNENIQIKNVLDDGPRIGTARDKSVAEPLSGYALSLKLGCNACIVDTYTTTRPDGFMDVLHSDGMTISNVTATYDSSFLNNIFPGWRFPGSGYSNVTFENISLRDTAVTSTVSPIGSAQQNTNDNIVFTNVQVSINRWSGKGLPLPNIAGPNNTLSLNYLLVDTASRLMKQQNGAGAITLQATPAKFSAGGYTTVTWDARDATSCSPSGAWAGLIGTSGSRVVKLTGAGSYAFTIRCQNANSSSTTTLPVDVM